MDESRGQVAADGVAGGPPRALAPLLALTLWNLCYFIGAPLATGAGGREVCACARTTPNGSKRSRPRAYRKSGFHALVAATTRDGLSALDGRATQARAIKLWTAQVAADLGGDLSAQELTLLDVAAVDMALLAAADAWLKENAGQVVNKRKRTFVPLVKERLAVAAHLAELLKTLGTKRRARPLPSLSAHIAASEKGEAPTAGDSPAA